MKKFGERIKQERTRLGLTQEELSKKIGVDSKSIISKWENGGVEDVYASNLFSLADVFNVSARWLLTGEGPREISAKRVESKEREDLDLIIDKSFEAMKCVDFHFSMKDRLEVIKFVMSHEDVNVPSEIMNSVLKLIALKSL